MGYHGGQNVGFGFRDTYHTHTRARAPSSPFPKRNIKGKVKTKTLAKKNVTGMYRAGIGNVWRFIQVYPFRKARYMSE